MGPFTRGRSEETQSPGEGTPADPEEELEIGESGDPEQDPGDGGEKSGGADTVGHSPTMGVRGPRCGQAHRYLQRRPSQQTTGESGGSGGSTGKPRLGGLHRWLGHRGNQKGGEQESWLWRGSESSGDTLSPQAAGAALTRRS